MARDRLALALRENLIRRKTQAREQASIGGRLRITGGAPLVGRVPISGAKNATLPIMVTCLMTPELVVLDNVPKLTDVANMIHLLEHLGVTVSHGDTLHLQAETVATVVAPHEFVRRMRASILVLAPLLARCGEAVVSLPGGCEIGERPIDLHLLALQALGAEIRADAGHVIVAAPQGLTGGRIVMNKVSVGATETALMAACVARGVTTIEGAACEPEITDLGHCLQAMGAQIDGLGTTTVTITGVPALTGARHRVIPDRIETGTYAVAAHMTGGDLELIGARGDHLAAPIEILTAMGAEVHNTEKGLRIKGGKGKAPAQEIITRPYPRFPTDLQAQFMTALSIAQGTSVITEAIFENRFMHVPELRRLGAKINIDGDRAHIEGVKALSGAPVRATDLRAGVCLVLAGLVATGETTVERLEHLDRGYADLEGKLKACGAQIERLAAAV
ncbi:MAG: UDP-N-acetylglucosamine 1-carboxyvinyltransferase [Pseudomonadota bacterium]